MKKFALLAVSLLAVAGVLNQLPPVQSQAEAAPKYQGTLTVTDGGQSNVLCLSSTNSTVRLQSTTGTQFVVRTCETSTCVSSVANDFRPLNSEVVISDAGSDGRPTTTFRTNYTPDEFPMGVDKCIVAQALDAGDPAVHVYKMTKNGP